MNNPLDPSCEECGHVHAGPELGGICIGCIFPVTTPAVPQRGGVDAIIAAADRATAATTAVDEIRALHRRRPLLIRGTTVEKWQCAQCDAEFPCPTIAILERHGL